MLGNGTRKNTNEGNVILSTEKREPCIRYVFLLQTLRKGAFNIQ